jgi:hypothetical protein
VSSIVISTITNALTYDVTGPEVIQSETYEPIVQIIKICIAAFSVNDCSYMFLKPSWYKSPHNCIEISTMDNYER